MQRANKVQAFVTSKGVCPYRDFLCAVKRSGAKTKRIEALVVLLAERGFELAATDCIAPVRGKIWELKPDPFRVFFFARERLFILLNGYRKKGRKTPEGELRIAERLHQEAMEEGE